MCGPPGYHQYEAFLWLASCAFVRPCMNINGVLFLFLSFLFFSFLFFSFLFVLPCKTANKGDTVLGAFAARLAKARIMRDSQMDAVEDSKKEFTDIVMCPKRFIGRVIGKGGETINAIRQRCSMIPRASFPPPPPLPSSSM
jgi:hypothetical protein